MIFFDLGDLGAGFSHFIPGQEPAEQRNLHAGANGPALFVDVRGHAGIVGVPPLVDFTRQGQLGIVVASRGLHGAFRGADAGFNLVPVWIKLISVAHEMIQIGGDWRVGYFFIRRFHAGIP